MFKKQVNRRGYMDVGRKNILTAKEVLEAEGFRLAGGEVGGPIGRKVFFDTAIGGISVQRVGNIDINSH